jgi:hypothetical protein
MAYETLVDEIRDVIRRLREEKGDLVLAMLVATSWGEGAPWNFVLSAEWMDSKSRKEVIGYVTDLLRKYVSRGNWSSIQMVSILNTNDPFVRALNQAFDVTNSTSTIQNCEIFGFEVVRGIILESHRPRTLSTTTR